MKRFSLTLAGFFIIVGLQAQMSLPAIFCNNMVLQQNSQVPIWGQGYASQQISLLASWLPNDTVKTMVNSQGRWKAELNTPKAGGPYTLKVIGSSTIELSNVMIGEVWLCSGQSNMEWSANNSLLNKEEEIKDANYPNIRFFKVANRGADFPQNDCEGQWVSCTPETMRERSAVAYFFARKLQKEMNVPVGLIISAWGGTPAEVWTPKQAIEENNLLKSNVPTKEFAWWPIESGVLYNQMINPVIKYRIAGALWYQGESNIDRNATYDLLMQTMIGQWRKNNGHDFPFYFVQIAPYTYQSKTNAAALLREQQEKTAREMPNTGMVVVSDLVDDPANIHPIDKQNVGLRLANLALAETYAQPIKGYKSPVLQDSKIEGNKIILTFSNAEQGLQCKDKVIKGLAVTDGNGKTIATKHKIVGNTLELLAKKLPQSVDVSYCFDDATIGNLFGVEGNLPVAPFRLSKHM